MSMRVTPLASLALATSLLFFVGCAVERLDPVPDAGQTRATHLTERSGSDIDLDFLLSLSFSEAAMMTGQTMTVPPFFRVAADEIHHDPVPEGRQLEDFRAKGSVFLEINFGDEALIAICEDAEVSMDRVVLRGMPALRRGMSVIEAAEDETVFYITKNDVSATGPHLLREVGDTSGAMMAMTNPLLPSPEGEMLESSGADQSESDDGGVEEVELDAETKAMLEAQGIDFSDTGLPGTEEGEDATEEILSAEPNEPEESLEPEPEAEAKPEKKKGVFGRLFSPKKKEPSEEADSEEVSEKEGVEEEITPEQTD